MSIGKLIRQKRIDMGIGIREMHRQTGVARSSIDALENNRPYNGMGDENIRKLLRFLKITQADIDDTNDYFKLDQPDSKACIRCGKMFSGPFGLSQHRKECFAYHLIDKPTVSAFKFAKRILSDDELAGAVCNAVKLLSDKLIADLNFGGDRERAVGSRFGN